MEDQRQRLSRRQLIAYSAAAGSALGLGSTFWSRALAEPAKPGVGPYGPLQGPDANGLLLPAGFTSRIVAQTGSPVGDTDYVWSPAPDGAATFPTASGGWIQTVNHETLFFLGGGVSAIEYDADGTIIGAYRILDNTNVNCAGGPTPWGTWLSGEEYDLTEFTAPVLPGFPFGPGVGGQIHECDPTGAVPGAALPALGIFSHEAAAVDPMTNHVYLTEDQGDGHFYRFRPDIANVGGRPDLTAGTLEAAVLDDPSAVPMGSSAVSWLEIPDPAAVTAPTRKQVEASRFRRGEGAWYDYAVVYFVTTSDDRVWAYDTTTSTMSVVYDKAVTGGELEEPDNITVNPFSGELFVAEDDDNLELVVITPPAPGRRTRESAPFMRITGQSGTEVAGPCFDPSGTRLYFSSQRGIDADRGITYEVSGTFTTRPPGLRRTLPEQASSRANDAVRTNR